jgi:hypothetical protein
MMRRSAKNIITAILQKLHFVRWQLGVYYLVVHFRADPQYIRPESTTQFKTADAERVSTHTSVIYLYVLLNAQKTKI